MMRSFALHRRHFAVATVTAVLLAGTVACSSTPTPSETSEEEIDLSLMIWDPGQTAGVQKAVDGFEFENPNVKVSVQQVPQDQYYTKLDASLAAGEGPDVMWQSSRAPDYVNGGALQSLDEYIERDGLKLDELYPEKFIDLYKFDDQQYGIPKDQDTWTFVYNAAVFEKLGVTDVPTADWTWDDMVRIAEEVKSKQTSDVDYPLFYDRTFNNGIASLIHQLGGTVIDDGEATVASPEGKEALEMVKQLQDDGLIPVVANAADYSSVNSLISGTLAMSVIPSWNLSLLTRSDAPDDTFHVVPLPSVNGSVASDTNSLSYVMNVNSSEKDAAWELIKFLTSDKGAILHAEGGAGVPANVSEEAQDAFVETNDKLVGLKEAVAASQKDNYLRTSSEFPKFRPSITEIESTVIGPFFAGTLSVDDATAKIDEIINKAIN